MTTFNFDAPKTENFIELRNNLKINDKKFVLVLASKNKNVYLSSRNLKGVKVITSTDLSTYDIMNASTIAFVESSIDSIHKNFGL